jgi:protein TonB
VTQKPVFMEGLFTLRNLRSMGAAAVLEILIACGIAALLIWHQLRIEVLPPPIVDPISHLSEQTLPQPHEKTVAEPKSPQTQKLDQVDPVRTRIPTQTTQPVQSPQDPSVSTGAGDMLARFEADMTSAIDAAKVYPKIAILKGEQGVVTVSFDYIDGLVSNIHLDKPSGSHAIDASAIQAVQRAALPRKPAEVAGQDHFTVTLDYRLGG